jgi:hypothetical protein
MATPGED